MIRKSAFFAPVLLVSLLAAAQTTASSAPDPWAGWQFLLGTFDAGQSSGVPGSASSGAFTLASDLNGNVLVRKNHADYPASKDHSAFSHDDLMIVWHEGAAAKALYTDSEGHVIHYNATLSGDGKQIVFLSDNSAGPQYRLTYDDLGNGAVRILFEVAPPGSSGEFAKYIEATVHRKGA
jgi:hypothetical protein